MDQQIDADGFDWDAADERDYQAGLEQAHEYLATPEGGVLKSVLYDLDLLPEQVAGDLRNESRMIYLCQFFRDYKIGEHVDRQISDTIEEVFGHPLNSPY